ncbi:MAG: Adenylate kinase, partial [Parcubacteria group bacterium GW2011_GWA2_42_35]
MSKKEAIIVLGKPGSGKGTQAKLLADKLGFFHFLTSKIGKEFITSHDDPETKKQEDNYKAGVLFDPAWIFGVVIKKTKEILESYSGVVYDGSPRTLYEAERFLPFLSEAVGKDNIIVFEIKVLDEELKKRLVKRLVCAADAEHVFISSEKLKTGDQCPEGDGILKIRDLDDQNIFKVRISEHYTRVVPAIDYLRKNYCFFSINGEQPIEDVHKDISEIYDN